MLPQEKIDILVRQTIEVKTISPQLSGNWLDFLQKERERYLKQAESADIVAFFDALLDVVNNKTTVLPDENVYQTFVQRITDGINRHRTVTNYQPPYTPEVPTFESNAAPEVQPEQPVSDEHAPPIEPAFAATNPDAAQPEADNVDPQAVSTEAETKNKPAASKTTDEPNTVKDMSELFNLLFENVRKKKSGGNPFAPGEDDIVEDILPQSSIDALIRETIMVRATQNANATMLSNFLLIKQQECFHRGAAYQHKATLMAILMAILDGREPVIPPGNPYKKAIEDAEYRIRWIQFIMWNTIAVMTNFPEKKQEWQDKIEHELQKAFIEEDVPRGTFLALIHELVADDVYSYPENTNYYSPAWESVLNNIKNYHADRRLPLSQCINRTIDVMVTNNVRGWDDWHAKVEALLKFAQQRKHKHEIGFLQALLDILRSRPVRGILGNRYESEIRTIEHEIKMYPVKEVVTDYMESETVDAAFEVYMENRAILSSREAVELVLGFIAHVDDRDRKAHLKVLLESLLRARHEEESVIAAAFSQEVPEDDEIRIPTNKQYPAGFIESLYNLYIYHGVDQLRIELKYEMGMMDAEIDYLIQLIESMLFN